jgi:hypothetical protein
VPEPPDGEPIAAGVGTPPVAVTTRNTDSNPIARYIYKASC